MPLVKVKTKGQVTLPTNLRQVIGLEVGDFVDAKLEKGKITLTPQSIVDRAIAEGLEDFRQGRTYGPFNAAELDGFLAKPRMNIKGTTKR